jgi:hypothetical protein
MDGPYNRIRRECQGATALSESSGRQPRLRIAVVHAIVLGYVLSRYFPNLSMSTWVVPTIILLYTLSASSEPYGSVLGSHSFSRFSYFFEV